MEKKICTITITSKGLFVCGLPKTDLLTPIFGGWPGDLRIKSMASPCWRSDVGPRRACERSWGEAKQEVELEQIAGDWILQGRPCRYHCFWLHPGFNCVTLVFWLLQLLIITTSIRTTVTTLFYLLLLFVLITTVTTIYYYYYYILLYTTITFCAFCVTFQFWMWLASYLVQVPTASLEWCFF